MVSSQRVGQLCLAEFPDFHDGRRLVDAFSVFENWNHEVFQAISVPADLCLFPGFQRIEDNHILFLVELFPYQADQVCTDLSGLTVVDPVDSLVSGVVIFSVFSESLILGINSPVVSSLIAASLYTPPEGWVILGSDQISADTPGGDGGTLCLQAVDQIFVQIAGG